MEFSFFHVQNKELFFFQIQWAYKGTGVLCLGPLNVHCFCTTLSNAETLNSSLTWYLEHKEVQRCQLSLSVFHLCVGTNPAWVCGNMRQYCLWVVALDGVQGDADSTTELHDSCTSIPGARKIKTKDRFFVDNEPGERKWFVGEVCSQKVERRFSCEVLHSDSPVSHVLRTHSSWDSH